MASPKKTPPEKERIQWKKLKSKEHKEHSKSFKTFAEQVAENRGYKVHKSKK